MADFILKNNISKISSQSVLPANPIIGLVANDKWFVDDIDIVISGPTTPDRTAPIIIDFSFSLPTIVEYTLLGDESGKYIELNDGEQLDGGQSRFIRVTDGDKLNFRAKTAGDLNRAILGEP